MSELFKVRDELRAFAAERDWGSVPLTETSCLRSRSRPELLEPFQWLSTEEQSKHLTGKQLAAVRDELADVQST